MKKILILVAFLLMIGMRDVSASPPLSFISIDCTQYGEEDNPYVIMSHKGVGVVIPLNKLKDSKHATKFFRELMKEPHEEWLDPACKMTKV
jgi:hypothetical protein